HEVSALRCACSAQHTVRHVAISLCAPATSDFHTLSLHDALPISRRDGPAQILQGAVARFHLAHRLVQQGAQFQLVRVEPLGALLDRKSTRLNSSHVKSSYAVFCLKKKQKRVT